MKCIGPLLLSLAMLVAPAAWGLAAGETVPSFALPNAAGQDVDLDKLRGSVVYVDFWASWCAPCKRSFPWMNEMAQKYAANGLAIVAINVDKKRADAEKFLQVAPASFTIVYDPDGKAPARWQVKAMPSSYLVDASGRIVLVEAGFKDERKGEVEEKIRAALGMR